MLDTHIRDIIDKPLNNIASLLSKFGIKSNHITFFALIPAIIGVYAIINGVWLLAICMIMLNRLCDGLDGAVARQTKTYDIGAYIDIVFDFIFYASIPMAFALQNPEQNAIAAIILIFTFMGTGSSFLAYAIFAHKYDISLDMKQKKGFYYIGGLTEGTETIACFLLMCIFHDYFIYFAYGYAGLCLLTTITRIIAAFADFKE